MKRLTFILCVAAWALASCQKEMPSDNANGTKVTVTVGSDLTKTALGEKDGTSWPVLWQSGDKIDINGRESAPLTEGGDVTAEFSFEDQLTAPFKAAYPSSVMTGIGTGVLPAAHDYTAGSFDPDAGVLLGTGDESGVTFNHAMAYIAFVPQGDGATITSLELTSVGGEKLSGAFTTDYSTLTMSGEASDKMTVNCSTPVALGNEIIAAIPAQTYSQGFKLKFTDSEGGSMEKTAEGSFTAAAGHIYTTRLPYVADFRITELYLLGPATSAGWSLDLMEAFTGEDGIFTWEGELAAGDFRFQLSKPGDFIPALMKGSEEGKLVYVATYDEVAANPHLSVAEAGTYRIVVDAKDTDNLTYTITRINFVKELYLFGPATSAGWSLDLMEAFTGEDGIFTWEGELAAGDFRFQLSKPGDFIPALMKGTEEGKLVYVATYDEAAANPHLSVAEAGKYRIVVDGRNKNNLTYTITRINFVKELYLLGPATSAGWSLDLMEAFTGEDGIFTWEGELAAGDFRFQLSKPGDFIPALMKGTEEGKLVYVATYDEAAANPHLSVAEAGKYRIVVDGRSQDNLTYTITKL